MYCSVEANHGHARICHACFGKCKRDGVAVFEVGIQKLVVERCGFGGSLVIAVLLDGQYSVWHRCGDQPIYCFGMYGKTLLDHEGYG